MFDRIVQIVTLPISLPIWTVVVIIQRNMEPVDLDDFALI